MHEAYLGLTTQLQASQLQEGESHNQTADPSLSIHFSEADREAGGGGRGGQAPATGTEAGGSVGAPVQAPEGTEEGGGVGVPVQAPEETEEDSGGQSHGGGAGQSQASFLVGRSAAWGSEGGSKGESAGGSEGESDSHADLDSSTWRGQAWAIHMKMMQVRLISCLDSASALLCICFRKAPDRQAAMFGSLC